jgi:hypothetical protein
MSSFSRARPAALRGPASGRPVSLKLVAIDTPPSCGRCPGARL